MSEQRPRLFLDAIKRLVSAKVAEKVVGNPEAIERLRAMGLIDDQVLEGIADGTIEFDVMLAELRDGLRQLSVKVKEQPSLLEDLDVRPFDVLGGGSTAALPAPREDPLTVVFTDLEGFTSFTVSEGDGVAARVLDDHYRVVDRMVAGRGGRVWKRLGDGHMLSFPSPQSAVLCSLELIESAPADLHLRSGAHLGPVVDLRNDLAGSTVNMASRVADSAEGGEALVTEPVREEAAPLSGVTFGVGRDRQLKGFEEPVSLIPVVRFG